MEERKPITLEDLEKVKEALGPVAKKMAPVPRTFHPSWHLPEDMSFVFDNGQYHLHPLPCARLIRETCGSDEALDFMKKQLHIRIDQIFGRKS